MCRNRSNHPNQKHQSPKMKFYRGLRSFFIFNIVMSILYITGNGFDWFWKISAFWSIGLVIAYVKAFGMPGANGWLSEDWEAWMAEREKNAPATPRTNKPAWKEKDLV